MTGPGHESGGPEPRPDKLGRLDPDAELARRVPTDGQGARRPREAELGGADAVEKTTYVVGEGAEPEARPTGLYVARDAAGARSVAVWIVGGLAALIALVYALGIFA